MTYQYLLNKYGTTLSFQQAAEETGIYWQTIREMCLRGKIKTAKKGEGTKKTRWILTTKALANWIDEQSDKAEETTVVKYKTKYKKIV